MSREAEKKRSRLGFPVTQWRGGSAAEWRGREWRSSDALIFRGVKWREGKRERVKQERGTEFWEEGDAREGASERRKINIERRC